MINIVKSTKYFSDGPKIEWSLLAEKVECVDTSAEINKGRMKHLESCAISCKDEGSIFVYGTNDFAPGTRKSRCFSQGERNGDEGCQCICQKSPSMDGTCTTKEHLGYRMFTYAKGNILHFIEAFYPFYFYNLQ